MDFITECFSKFGRAFSEKLNNAGFTAEQTRRFLPETAKSLRSSIDNSNIEQMITGLLSHDSAQLLKTIDVESIAFKLDMNSGQIITGLNAISPVLSEALMQSNHDLVNTIAALAWQHPVTSDETTK
jgi:hypothetical protein